MRDYLATHLPQIWQDKTHPVSKLLFPLSLIYGLAISIRQKLYSTGIFKRSSVSVPVIVVGNITVGGTGKTPLVIWLANYLQQRNWNVGIISRGYGGSSPQWPVDVTLLEKPEIVGDEAVLLRHKLDQPLAVSPNRLDSAQLLIDKYNIDIIISDDGLQHLALKRDLEIIVIDADRKFGNGRLLPSGPLRQTSESTSQDAIKIYSGNKNLDQFEFNMQFKPTRFCKVNAADQSQQIDYFENMDVNAVAGIGNPEKFFNTLKSLNIKANTKVFPDHHVFQSGDLIFNDNKPILMTEKDAVKCREFTLPNAWYLEIEAQPNQTFINKLQRSLAEITDHETSA